MEKAKVYFTKEITSESLIKIYEKVGKELQGNVAVLGIGTTDYELINID